MKEYTVLINGMEHTVQLDEEAAKTYPGIVRTESKQSVAPANKARAAVNKVKAAGDDAGNPATGK